MLAPGGPGPADLGSSGAFPAQALRPGRGHKPPQPRLGPTEGFSKPSQCPDSPLCGCSYAKRRKWGKRRALWPQRPGVACLLPPGKREFGEISAADVPDNTVERQLQQGMCLPDEMCFPSSNHRATRDCLQDPARVSKYSGVPEFMSRTPASPCVLPDFI